MKTSDFDYELPTDRIAQIPSEPRDSARLLVDCGQDSQGLRVEHRHVHDLPNYLRPGDLLVVNDTRVIPGRVHLQRSSGGAVEILLLDPLNPSSTKWTALVRPGGRLKEGEILHHRPSGTEVIFHGRHTISDSFVIELCFDGEVLQLLNEIGELPLPPYITGNLSHNDRYQTVYSRRPASAAAPTAGLHFTPQLLETLQNQGIGFARVELVVGLDTFQPIQVEDPLEHKMHTEFYSVSEQVMQQVDKAERVIAVGTTAVRSLESALARNALSGRTDLFIHRGFNWQAVDLMLTNFHLPRTTLLLMIDAFIGDRWRDIYATALESGYRFLSLGDAMLLNRHAIEGS
ncbi:MAG: tRNA preQ1(34) S-adenosylmethionine ribosyltransferase-isomerase QueA [Actinomycetes bacterium]